jgi:hypothetical protein
LLLLLLVLTRGVWVGLWCRGADCTTDTDVVDIWHVLQGTRLGASTRPPPDLLLNLLLLLLLLGWCCLLLPLLRPSVPLLLLVLLLALVGVRIPS